MIEDAEGPTSIAGVMGGARSEVRPETTRVLLEVATWSGPNIHRTSWSLGLRSEASGRFEKGLQPEQCLHAQAVATTLMIECCGARVAPGTIDVGWEPAPEQVIRLREARVQAILGLPVAARAPGGDPARRSTSDGRGTDPGAGERDGLDVTVPALRRDDVTREVDLIEEVARIDGLERLPATLPARRGAVGLLSHAQRVRRAAEDALVGRGLHEVVGWSFTDPGLLDRLRLPAEHPLRRVVRLENPMSETQSIDAPDAARLAARRRAPQRRAQRPRRGDLRVRGRVSTAPTHPPRRARHVKRRHAGRGAPRARRAADAARWADGRQILARGARRGGLLRGQGAAGGGARQVPRRLVGAAGRRVAVPASRPQRRGARRRRGAEIVRLGFVGEVHPLVAARVGSGAHGRVRDRPRQARRRGPARAGLRAVRVGAVAAPGPRGRAARRRGRRAGAGAR